MEDLLHEMLSFVFQHDLGFKPSKARSLAAHFADIGELLETTPEDLTNIRSISGRRGLITLTEEEIRKIIGIRNLQLLYPDESVADNHVAAMARDFTRRQLEMLQKLNLSTLSPNPILIRALGLKSPKEVIQINVYMSATRSIVTSMGFFVEKLLCACSDSTDKAPSPWDIIKTDTDGNEHWIQVKSGPNDMDKDQIVTWAQKIEEKIAEGAKAYIGMTYGKRSNDTVTFGIMRQHLVDWELKTLIGKELWDFVSDDPTFHDRLFEILRRASRSVLNDRSILNEIESCIERILAEFLSKYGDGEEGVRQYISDIF